MRSVKATVLLVSVLLCTACSQGSQPTNAKPSADTSQAPALPKCIVSWTEAGLGGTQLWTDMASWKSAQKVPVTATKLMTNRFTQPATRGDAVYVVNTLDGKMIEAVGIDNTIPGAQSVATTRGLKIGDSRDRALALYGPPIGGDRHGIFYLDVTSGQPTLKLIIDIEQNWMGEDTIQSIEWVALAPPPKTPNCEPTK